MAAFAVPFTRDEEIFGKGGPQDAVGVNLEQQHYHNEFSQEKLNEIHRHLWSAGSKMNISPLHHQKVLLRKIILSERSDLHLVWFDRIIYIQPLQTVF